MKVPLRNRNSLKRFIKALFEKEDKKLLSLDYIFCSDEELLEMNKQYLAHDNFTDIITFDLSEGKGIVGEIYISTDRVADNATTFNTPASRELHRVVFHGALHLCGYKDKSRQQQQVMRAKEEEYLSQYVK